MVLVQKRASIKSIKLLWSITSEINGYARKERISRHILRLDKTFTTIVTGGSTLLAAYMAEKGKFNWSVLALIGMGVPAWISERLNEIKVKDIVKWWSRTWPFEDPGIGFVIWEKRHQKTSNT